MTTITKTQSAQPAGQYVETNLDILKEGADFRIMQVSPFYIRWADGRGEVVTKQKLQKLQKSFTWTTDF